MSLLNFFSQILPRQLKLAPRYALSVIVSFFCYCLTPALAYEAPVTDLSSEQLPAGSEQLPAGEEILKLKRQMTHLLESNFAGKVEALQQEMQTLRGTIEKQSHDIKILQTQLNQFHQESDNRAGRSEKVASIPERKIAHSYSKTKNIQTTPLSDYKKAIEAIRHKKYQEAQDLLVQYLAIHPKDSLADNAHFWLGEVYYQQKKNQLAKREFEIIQRDYPASPKLANALLKIGYLEADDENFEKAKEIFNRLLKTFPGTPSAQLAKIKLDKMARKMI